jgi:hypothetical protein
VTGCSTASGTLPELYIGPYREYLNTLRQDGKVGMVIITCVDHEDDVSFKKECLCDGELVRFLREKDILVWAGDVRSREGYQGRPCLVNIVHADHQWPVHYSQLHTHPYTSSRFCRVIWAQLLSYRSYQI